jgi:putative spermidine/putrescine transport system substrate-binding protein
MTTAWNGRVHNANKEGKNFKIVWDHEILDSNFWAIPKGAKNMQASMDFIKFAAAPEQLAATTKYIPYGPVRSTAAKFVAPADAANLPTSPDNMKTMLTLDNAFWADKGDEIRKRFTTWISQ